MSFKRNPPVSFEMFPPKTFGGFEKLDETCKQLNELRPDFFSVTFGAAGSAQEKTRDVVRRLINNKLSTVPHLSCVGMTLSRLMAILEEYKSLEINRLVVIRGDEAPGDSPMSRDFRYAVDLVKYIRKITGDYFHITIAAYPEFHPQAVDCEADLINFKGKVDAGANTAVTQFFFNSDAYFRFKESCDKMAIGIPITPGILPIYNYANLLRISAGCGAEIPLWLRKRLEKFSNDPLSFAALGVEVVTQFCETLIQGGAEALHFYTLNHADTVTRICANLGILPKKI